MFAQLADVHKFAPHAKTFDIISDAGSGFKSTACAFGLMWASHLGLLPGGLKLNSWMYPAAGEAKQPETDGAMPRYDSRVMIVLLIVSGMTQTNTNTIRLKRRRWQAISAKAIVNPDLPKAVMAITPATNVACMKYNGGGAAETICMIDLANPAAKAAR